MSDVGLALAAGCVLQVAETEVAPGDADAGFGWAEQTHLELIAAPACGWVDLSLPAGAVLADHRARQRLGDGTGHRLGEERWEYGPRGPDGAGVVRVHLPELVGGDRVVLEVTRWLPPGPFTWRPGAARYVSADVRGGVVGVGAGDDGGDTHAWATNVDAAYALRFVNPGAPPTPETPRPRVAGDVRVELALKIVVPGGDPQLRLYPGGGSAVETDLFAVVPAEDAERVWPLPVPPGVPAQMTAEPAGAATLARDPTGARLVVAPSEAEARIHVRWTSPDAPTFGSKPWDVDALTVDAPGGEVRWDGDSWWLYQMNGRPVLPDRAVLVRALDKRFREAAIPEPGAPMTLRGRDADWALAADLRPALLDRVAIGDWPSDPVWPRKLIRARKTAALTPTEAALTLWLYAKQLRLDAQWALIRPAWAPGPATDPADGPDAADFVPTRFTAAAVRITIGGETRWIDPTCAVCAPFELPPELEGARALGPGVEVTPAPTVGHHTARIGAESVSWELDGPPALLLRRWLDRLPADERTRSLAERIGGVGAKLVELTGVDQAGAPIRVVATRGSGLFTVPTELPVPGADGTGWLDWVGVRTTVWADGSRDALPDAAVDPGPGEATGWSRRHTDAGVVEAVTVSARTLSAALLARIDAARAPPAPPVVAPDPPPVPVEGPVSPPAPPG